jgi:uncharacterized damage-inducible protein DinB
MFYSRCLVLFYQNKSKLKSIKSSELLNQLESQVENHLKETIELFQNLPESKLLHPAVNGGWSIAQCLEHLNRYANYYHAAIEKGLAKSNSPTSEEFKSTWFGNYFTKMLDPDSGQKPIKAFKEYKPVRELDAHKVVADFISHLEELLTLLRKAAQHDLNKIKISISIARWLKTRLGDTFRFLIAHNERHLRQAKRNLH